MARVAELGVPDAPAAGEAVESENRGWNLARALDEGSTVPVDQERAVSPHIVRAGPPDEETVARITLVIVVEDPSPENWQS